LPAAAAGTPRCGKCHQPLPWVADADDTTFGEIAEAAKIPVIVDLWAPWCGPYRMVSPALEQLARDLAGQMKLVKVNVDVSPQISQRFEAVSDEEQGAARRLSHRVVRKDKSWTTIVRKGHVF
jgi:thioredoxin 2